MGPYRPAVRQPARHCRPADAAAVQSDQQPRPYLVFVGTPALLYAALVLGLGQRGTSRPGDEPPSVSLRGAAGLALAFAGVAAANAVLQLASQPLTPMRLDFFHHGEWL
ncbi:MAG: hypothetical protein AB7V27_19300 [Candidatus Binatia bacterium]